MRAVQQCLVDGAGIDIVGLPAEDDVMSNVPSAACFEGCDNYLNS